MAVEAPKKPTKKATGKGMPAQEIQDATTKAGSGDLVPFNFAVPAELKKEFKMVAAMHDMSMVAVLKAGFELFKQSKGVQ